MGKRLYFGLFSSLVLGCQYNGGMAQSHGNNGNGNGDPILINYGDPRHCLLERYQEPRPGYGGYAFMLFTESVGEGNRQRYEAIYDAFRTVIPEEGDSPPETDVRRWIMAHWLVRDLPTDATRADQVIKLTDYTRCHEIIERFDEHTEPKFADSGGPLLVAVRRRFDDGDPPRRALVLDLSSVGEENFAYAIRAWKSHVVRRPDLWEDGWQIERIRIAIRSKLDAVGAKIGEAIIKRIIG